MGIYPAECSICKKDFLWFSANPIQICDSCRSSNFNIVLNKYQRDNLLWLLTLVSEGDLEFTNTGDWAGEVRWMLDKTHGSNPSMQPNVSLEEFRMRKGVKNG